MTVKEGSLWWDGKGNNFIVLSVTVVEGNTWVHYRQDLGIKTSIKECKEYSCYEESFTQRFSPRPA